MNTKPTPTPGPWLLWHSGYANAPYVLHVGPPPVLDRRGHLDWKHGGEYIGEVSSQRMRLDDQENIIQEGAANATLIAEAGTVYHETGLTPRELAEQRRELLEALQKLVDYAELSDECHYGTVGTNFVREVCLPVIARATGSQP